MTHVRAQTEVASTESTWQGIACASMDLSAQEPRWLPSDHAHARSRVLVSLHGEVLGYLEFPQGRENLSGRQVRDEAVRRFPDRIATHLRLEGREVATALAPEGDAPLAPAGPLCPRQWHGGALPTMTIAVCTRDRADILSDCLDHLTRMPGEDLDILVIDNAPTDQSTRTLVQTVQRRDPRVRYHREPRPGLSCARNAALEQARGEILAFTDDDVSVDPGWAQAIRQAAAAGAGCVTGLVATASVDCAAEAYFDARSPRGPRAAIPNRSTSPRTAVPAPCTRSPRGSSAPGRTWRCAPSSSAPWGASTRRSVPGRAPREARTWTSSCGS